MTGGLRGSIEITPLSVSFLDTLVIRSDDGRIIFMPPKELWEAYSNRTVRPSVSPSVRQSVRPAFVFGPYLLYSLR